MNSIGLRACCKARVGVKARSVVPLRVRGACSWRVCTSEFSLTDRRYVGVKTRMNDSIGPDIVAIFREKAAEVLISGREGVSNRGASSFFPAT